MRKEEPQLKRPTGCLNRNDRTRGWQWEWQDSADTLMKTKTWSLLDTYVTLCLESNEVGIDGAEWKKEREKINGVSEEQKVERFKRLFLDSCISKVKINLEVLIFPRDNSLPF